MRFLRLSYPPVARIILVESGSRSLTGQVIPKFREVFGEQVRIDLVTCYAGLPDGLDAEASTVYRIHEYRGRRGRERLFSELRRRLPCALAIICSGEPVMTRWKWALALRLPAKMLVVNENSDFFWFDRGNWPTIRHFVLSRGGLSGADAVATIGRVLLFPFVLAYLLAYAAALHLRRKVHG